jgi:hypothetical protein
MHDDMTGMKSGRIVYWGILNYYDFLLEQVPVPVSSSCILLRLPLPFSLRIQKILKVAKNILKLSKLKSKV